MTTRIRAVFLAFGWRQRLLVALLILALLAAALFAVRTVRVALYWPQHRDEPIERWMPVNYVAHSYDVPPEVLWAALGLPAERRRDFRPLGEIATAQGRSFEEVRASLEDAIARARQTTGPPSSPSSSPGDRSGP